jgi:hypothetical protein
MVFLLATVAFVSTTELQLVLPSGVCIGNARISKYNWIRVLIKQFNNRTSLNVTSSASVDIASRIRILIEQFDNRTSLIYLILSNPTIII